MKNFWRKFNELIFSPIAILVFAAAYYGVYKYFGPEAGLIPPGYFTNVLAGAAIMYIAGWMATLALRLNMPKNYNFLYDKEKFAEMEGTDVHTVRSRILAGNYLFYQIASVCAYFMYYALSIWALSSML